MTAFPGPAYMPSVAYPWFQQPALQRVASAATTNATSVKTSAAMLQGFFLVNKNGAARFLKFYDKASAPVVGTDTPLFTVAVPASAAAPAYADFTVGVPFVNGLAFAITANIADSDTNAVSLDDVHGVIVFS